MSDIITDLAALAPKPPRIQCRTCLAILTDPRLEQGIAAARSNGVTQKEIVATLTKHGYDVSEASLNLHLKRGHKPL